MPKITGTVLDVNDNPVENATVVLPSAGLFALTDEMGYYEIDNVPPGIQRINVVQRYYQKFRADMHINEDMIITINLDRN